MANTTGISAQFNNGAVSTMSSREIADIAEARHNDVVATIDRLFDKGLLRSSRKSRHENTGGRPIEVYDLVERDVYLIVAGYSDEVRARIIDRWQELESGAALPRNPATAALSFWDAAVKSLNIAPSGHLGGVRAIATSYGYDALLPHLPVYAIDAPPSITGAAPTSSMPTASLTVLLAEHEVGMTARTANKMLEKAGILVELTRPSSRGTSHKYWSLTDVGLMFGKNVVNPSNPKETQPHWYRQCFKTLVDTYLLD